MANKRSEAHKAQQNKLYKKHERKIKIQYLKAARKRKW